MLQYPPVPLNTINKTNTLKLQVVQNRGDPTLPHHHSNVTRKWNLEPRNARYFKQNYMMENISHTSVMKLKNFMMESYVEDTTSGPNRMSREVEHQPAPLYCTEPERRSRRSSTERDTSVA